MYQNLLHRTFAEMIHLTLDGSYNQWEIDIEVSGSIEPEEPPCWDYPGSPAHIELDGLLLRGARIENLEVDSSDVLDTLETYLNRVFWDAYHPEHDALEHDIRSQVEEALSND